MHDFFVALGLSEMQTAAILGNLGAESGLNPAQQERGYENGVLCRARPVFTPGCGVGIAQWTTLDRQNALLEYAGCTRATSRIGCSNATDMRTQLTYLWKEITKLPKLMPGGVSTHVLRDLRKARTLDDATEAWSYDVERSTDPRDITRRQACARSYYNLFAKGPTPAC
jgi:hypothetical protein